MDRMRFKPYRWLVTYAYAWHLCNSYGERATPWAVRFVWPVAKRTVDKEYPR